MTMKSAPTTKQEQDGITKSPYNGIYDQCRYTQNKLSAILKVAQEYPVRMLTSRVNNNAFIYPCFSIETAILQAEL